MGKSVLNTTGMAKRKKNIYVIGAITSRQVSLSGGYVKKKKWGKDVQKTDGRLVFKLVRIAL